MADLGSDIWNRCLWQDFQLQYVYSWYMHALYTTDHGVISCSSYYDMNIKYCEWLNDDMDKNLSLIHI